MDSVAPGDIITAPGTKIDFKAPYDELFDTLLLLLDYNKLSAFIYSFIVIKYAANYQ